MTWWYRWLCRLAGVLGAVCEYRGRGSGRPRGCHGSWPRACGPPPEVRWPEAELTGPCPEDPRLTEDARLSFSWSSSAWRCSHGLGWDCRIPSLWAKLVHKWGRGQVTTG